MDSNTENLIKSAFPQKVGENVSLDEMYQQIDELSGEIKEGFLALRESEKLAEVIDMLNKAGPMGAMALIPKLNGILSEFSPAVPALKKMVLVSEIQHQMMGLMIQKIAQLEGRNDG